MDVKFGYKRTERGMLPEEWEVKNLRDVVEFLDGRRRPIKESERANIDGEFPYYGASGIIDYVSNYIFDDDLILIGEDGENIISRNSKLVFRVHGKIWVNNHAHVLKPQKNVDSGFLTEYLESLDYEQYNTGTAQPKLNKKVCSGIIIALPPLAEQRAIATALTDVDALLTSLDMLITKKRDIKQATMQQLLTGKTRLPGFKGKWENASIEQLEKREILKLSRGKVISAQDIQLQPGDYPIYSSSIRKAGLFGSYRNYMFDEELITWSVDGGGNFFYRHKHKFSVTNVSGTMKVNTAFFDYRFLAMELELLHSRLVFDYQVKAHPSVIRKLYTLAIPSLKEQQAIAAVLSDMDAEIVALEQKRDKIRALKQGMMQELLTGKTRLL